jgi:hypothetical protein
VEEARRLKEQALSAAMRIGHIGMRQEIRSHINNLSGSLQKEDDNKNKDGT